MLACQRLGMNLRATWCQADKLKQMKYSVKHMYGVSASHCESTDTEPLFGTGQGSGASPAIWLGVVVILLNELDRISAEDFFFWSVAWYFWAVESWLFRRELKRALKYRSSQAHKSNARSRSTLGNSSTACSPTWGVYQALVDSHSPTESSRLVWVSYQHLHAHAQHLQSHSSHKTKIQRPTSPFWVIAVWNAIFFNVRSQISVRFLYASGL